MKTPQRFAQWLWRLGLLLTLLAPDDVVCQTQTSDYECNLSRRDVQSLLDGETRTWRITDAALLEHDIQGIVNCTNEGDVISLETTGLIRPDNRIVIPWSLTIGRLLDGLNRDTNDMKTRLTCPSDDGIFLIREASVLLRNLAIEECNFSSTSNVRGIIETDSCSGNTDSVVVQLHDVDFIGNSNLNGSVGVVVQDPACYTVELQEVLFQSNRYAASSKLSRQNDLRSVTLIGNEVSENAMKNEPLFQFPRDSMTFVHRLIAETNNGSLFFSDNGNLVMSNSSFVLNSTPKRGVIMATGSNVSISSCLFDSNFCKGNGAAVFLTDGSSGTFRSVRFINNSAHHGGALYARDSQDLDFTSCHLESNIAERSGGALYMDSGGMDAVKSLRVSNCSFIRNSSPESGSGIYMTEWNDGRIYINASQFTGHNPGIQIPEEHGGAIALTNSDDIFFRVSESVFDSNIGNWGGAMHFNELSGRLIFLSSNFTRNQASGHEPVGAGLYLFSRHFLIVTFMEVRFEGNEGETASGGAMHATGEGIDLHLTDSAFLRNSADRAAAIYVTSLRELIVANCTFQRNEAMTGGGALLLSDLTHNAEIRDSTFERNKATSGGAILLSALNSTINSCHFEKNEAVETGGAMSIEEGPGMTQFTNSTFLRNKADIGGALYAFQPHVHVYDGCNFEENNASYFGGAIYVHVNSGLDKIVIEDSAIIRNNASVGGGALFQIDRDDFQVDDPEDWNVQILDTAFEENFAERAGGALFIDRVEALDTDCGDVSPLAELDDLDGEATNFNCSSMRDNAVGETGYGANVATSVTHFHVTLIFQNGTRVKLEPGETFHFSNWRSGELLPVMEVVVLDNFHQGPGLTNSRCAAPGEHARNLLVQYDGYAKATVHSPDHLIPNPLITDVSSGTGNITVGRPLSQPGTYSLLVWVADDEEENVMITLTVRECIINEHSDLNGTLCTACDTNHFNFNNENEICTECNDDVDCFSQFTLPKPGYWNSFPCSHEVDKCIKQDACRDSNATEIIEMLEEEQIDCSFSEEFLQWYQDSLCEEGYAGPLCGSCMDSTGRVGMFTCRECPHSSLTILMILAAFLTVVIIVTLQIKGNLDTTVHWTLKLTCSTIRFRSQHSLNTQQSKRILETQHSDIPGNEAGVAFQKAISFKRKENLAKWKFVELLKITINFLQTVAAGVSLDVQWSDAILRLLATWDWFGGAVMESSAFAVDCLLPANWPTPRSVMHQTMLICLPVLVFLVIFLVWLRVSSRFHRRRYLAKRALLTVVVVFYVSYISLTKAAINIFYCVEVHDTASLETVSETHAYWALDTAVRCFEGSHRNLMTYVAIPVLFLCLLFPISLAIVLICARSQRKLESVWVQETVGLFFRGFERKFVFWDSIILLRKAVIAAIVVFAYSLGGNLQGLLAVGVLVLSLFMQMCFCPFNVSYGHLNRLESTSLLVSILTFLCGVTLDDPAIESSNIDFLLVSLVLISNVALTLLLLYLIALTKIEQVRFGLLAEGIDCETESNFWVVKAYVFSHVEHVREIAMSTFKKDTSIDSEEVSSGEAAEQVVEIPDRG